ncbi:hypothetical protein AL044_28750 [Pseudomonas amygdali pv. aesculi]|nr:hypothetical protein AL044_28750 [Pseudomonas amygdali pv. aesculi]
MIIRKGSGPLGKRQVTREDQAALLVALGDNIEEQVGFITTKRQVTDFIDDQQPGGHHHTTEVFLEPFLAVRSGQLQHQVSRSDKAGFDTGHHCPVGQGDGQVALAYTARSQEHDVLGTSNKTQCCQLLELCPRDAGGKREVVLLQRFHGGQRGSFQQGLSRAFTSGIGLGNQQLFEEVGKAVFAACCLLGQVRPVHPDALKL